MDSLDLEVLRSAIEWLHSGRRVALATVVHTWGSSPRPIGALAAIRDDGALAGSVSGGCVEDDLVARVRGGVLGGSRPETVTYGVSAEEAKRFGLPCGGTLEIVLEPLGPDHGLEEVLGRVERHERVRRTLYLESGRVTVEPARPGEQLRFEDGVLSTVYGPRWRLLLVGAGQLSACLARMARELDYQVTVCDPREEQAASWDVPGVEVKRGMPDEVVAEMNLDGHSAVITLTHDPKLDDLALLEALKSPAFYVGAIGSRKNSEARRRRLAQLDLSQQEIARLHAPVGLDLGCRTPPEIAVAILAEMTAVRNGVTLPELVAPRKATAAGCAT